MRSSDENLTLPRHSDINEAMRQPGQSQWPGSVGNDRSNLSGHLHRVWEGYSPRQQGERSVYEGEEGHPLREYRGTPRKAHFGTGSASYIDPSREHYPEDRFIRNKGSWPSRQSYLDDEAQQIIKEWEWQLSETRSRVYDWQKTVLKNQQEIEDLNNSISQLRSELTFTKDELKQLNESNIQTNEKFQELLLLERRNVTRLREEEIRYSRLENQRTVVLKEKAVAVARAEELGSLKSSLDVKINELETNAKVVSRLRLEAKAIAEKIVREKLQKYKKEKAVNRREVEQHQSKAVRALDEAKMNTKLLRDENIRLKQEIRAVKTQLSKQRAKKTFHVIKSGPQRYDGPARGKNNLFWLKFRNPELKEEFEGQESPVVTPTSTPESSPDP